MAEFKAGDCVTLISGGPAMTVKGPDTRQFANPGNILCGWFDGTKYKEGAFDPNMLKIVSDDPKVNHPSIVHRKKATGV